MLDLLTLSWSTLVAPRRVLRAFLRGRRSGVVGLVALPATAGLGLWGRWESERAARAARSMTATGR